MEITDNNINRLPIKIIAAAIKKYFVYSLLTFIVFQIIIAKITNKISSIIANVLAM